MLYHLGLVTQFSYCSSDAYILLYCELLLDHSVATLALVLVVFVSVAVLVELRFLPFFTLSAFSNSIHHLVIM